MQLVISLRKEVEDKDEGEQLYNAVKQYLASYPKVIISGYVTAHFELEPDPPPP